MRLLPVLLLLAGCRAAPAAPPFTLRFAVPGVVGTFGPASAEGVAALARDLAFEPLLRPDPSGHASEVLASWARAGDGLRVVLLPGVRLADGAHATRDDLAESLRAAGFQVRIDGDEVFLSSRRGAVAPGDLYHVGLGRRTADGWIGSRPFRLAAAGPGELLLERVRPAQGRVERVRLLAFPDARTAFVQLLRGEADAMIGLDDRMAQLVEGVGRLQLVRGESPLGLAVVFGPRLGAAERRALAAWLPRGELAAAAHEGCAPLASGGGALPPGRRLDVVSATLDPSGTLAGLALRRALGSRGGAYRRAEGGERVEAEGGFDLLVASVLVWPEEAALRQWRARPSARVTPGTGGDADEVARAIAEDPPLVPLCRRRRLAAVDSRVRNPRLGDWDVLGRLPEWEVTR
ncbi:periplasmic substrate-binding domain-containing protein [Anaeromyxobacter paludicola]|uniref:Uncharacterized protein n=1 Tax=Anaeromyxobacter paludicola TaxID=2918171 RepID=A0ABM7X7K1_9BACT|nr:hypothetical protein [Anaeromyxobacter paludicola]BDG07791.1 hypothetical protein AMPC_09040 [Anaeromyxobacter paludicola]